MCNYYITVLQRNHQKSSWEKNFPYLYVYDPFFSSIFNTISFMNLHLYEVFTLFLSAEHVDKNTAYYELR